MDFWTKILRIVHPVNYSYLPLCNESFVRQQQQQQQQQQQKKRKEKENAVKTSLIYAVQLEVTHVCFNVAKADLKMPVQELFNFLRKHIYFNKKNTCIWDLVKLSKMLELQKGIYLRGVEFNNVHHKHTWCKWQRIFFFFFPPPFSFFALSWVGMDSTLQHLE